MIYDSNLNHRKVKVDQAPHPPDDWPRYILVLVFDGDAPDIQMGVQLSRDVAWQMCLDTMQTIREMERLLGPKG